MDKTIQITKDWFEGKKTILGILAGAIYSILIYYGVVPTNEMIWLTLATYTGISFKLGINRIAKPVDNCPPTPTLPPAQKYIPSSPISEPPEVLAG